MCREKKVQYINEPQVTQKNDESDHYNPFVVDTVKKVCTAIIPEDSQWIVNMTLEGLTIPLKLDIGNDMNILLISYYKKLKRKPEIKPTKIRLTSYTGSIIPITRKIFITINRKGMLHELCLTITPRKVQSMRGKNTCEKFSPC